MKKKVAVICNHIDLTGLVFSYTRIYEKMGYEIKSFDIGAMSAKYMVGNSLMKKAQRYLNEEVFIRKGNRDLSVALKNFSPDIILMPGKTKILPGTIAYIKSFSPAKLVMIWQDTLCNLDEISIANAPLFDVTASYSSAAIPVLQKLGFANCVWMPFAGDLSIHDQPTIPDHYQYDLTFLGGWRPEREKALEIIAKNFKNIRMQVWGPNAKEYRSPLLKGKVITQAVRGKEFGVIINNSLISLNVIDDTNFPAANMRFFEVPTASGLQLCSDCPEMQNEFRDSQHLLYFTKEEELCAQVEFALSNPLRVKEIRRCGYQHILENHTYEKRASQLLSLLQ